MKKKIETPRTKAAKSARTMAHDYSYAVGWSEDDETYVARVAEFPSLGAHGYTEQAALRSLQHVVKAVLKDMAVSNEPTPQSFG